MSEINHINILGNAKRKYLREAARNLTLPKLAYGAGKVDARGDKLLVVLPTRGGGAAVYTAVPTAGFRLKREPNLKPRLSVVETPTPGERLKAAIDSALAELAEIERRARATQPESAIKIAAE
jgi:hypothetical protein